MSSPSDQKWTVVATRSFPHEAHLVATLLKDNEIQTVLKDEHVSEMYPGASLALGGVKVLVLTEDADKARKILDELGG